MFRFFVVLFIPLGRAVICHSSLALRMTNWLAVLAVEAIHCARHFYVYKLDIRGQVLRRDSSLRSE